MGSLSRRPVLAVWACLLAGPLTGLTGCARTNLLERKLVPPASIGQLDRGAEFLKAHMLDGGVYVLSAWGVEAGGRHVTGRGARFSAGRDTLATGELRVAIDSVAVFETNQTSLSPRIAALSVVTGASAALTLVCALDWKACFGSCPTFYVDGDPDSLLHAEGFSASVAPALEATDLDALFRVRADGRWLDLRMVNEALETHVVRRADLLVAPRPRGGRVLATPDHRFHEATGSRAPTSCSASEGDCRDPLLAFDGRERTSPADSFDLAARETIELTFAPVPPGEYGLMIAARQSLLSTYLFYQLLAYLGSRAGEYVALLERGDPGVRRALAGIGLQFGGIAAELHFAADRWVPIGATGEVGPLATDVTVLPLTVAQSDSLRLRLHLTRGNWRLDQVALVELGAVVTPRRLSPVAVFTPRGAAADPEALAALLDSSRVLTTLPGDTCRLRYELPGDIEDPELFLESRGYYLEWMRTEWLAEEDAGKALALLLDPAAALRDLAPAYKRIEPQMDAVFWRSRYAK